MSDPYEPVTSLSIARHALQFILRLALDAEPKRCCGLIGKKIGSTISHAAPLPEIGTGECASETVKNSDLQHILKKWATQQITPCGIFFNTQNGEIPDRSELEKLESSLKKNMPEFIKKPVIYMPLMLNTAGCLEAFTYLMSRDSLNAVPLILEEDGQQRENG